MFCQLEILRQCLPPSVRHTLAELPETLDETYERILSEIPKSNRVHAHRLLQCLTVAFRPLEVQELAEVLAVDFGTPGGIPELKEDLRWEDQEQAVLSACSSLISVVGPEGYRVVQFSHFSVKEFLTSDRLATSKIANHHIHLKDAHAIMAQACLSVLLRLDYDTKGIISFPLAQYATDYFGNHVEFEDVLSHIGDGVDHLLDADKPHFSSWLWRRSVRYSYGPLERLETVPLYYVVDSGYLGLASRLISKRPGDVNALGGFGTLLHAASHRGHCKMMGLLLEHLGVDVRNDDDQTPLHLAAEDGFLEVIRVLIECNADIEARDNQGQTPLYCGIVKGFGDAHLDVVKFLLTHGAETDTRDNNGSTLLHAASFTGSVNVAQILLKDGANVHAQDKAGRTPLYLAVPGLDDQDDIIRLLLEYGARVDTQDNVYTTPLHMAAQSGSVKAVRLFLEHGANVHAQDILAQTPLHGIFCGGIVDMPGFSFDVVRLLLEHGADIEAQDDDDLTPLHQAVQRGYVKAAGVLIEHGANIHAQNNKGRTPLHEIFCSIIEGWESINSDIIRLLLEHGADVDAQDNYYSTPLHMAVRCGEVKAAEVLLEHGADVDAQDDHCSTPLHIAAQRGRIEVAEVLLEHGASVDLWDDLRHTPLEVAWLNRNVTLVELLSKDQPREKTMQTI